MFASEAECSTSSCVLPPQWRQQSGKSSDYEEDNGDTQVHPDVFMAMHIAPFMLKISGCTYAAKATYEHGYCSVTIIGKLFCH